MHYFLAFAFAFAFFAVLIRESFVMSSESFSLASSSEPSSITSSTLSPGLALVSKEKQKVLTYASSRSGAGPPASFFGILPRSWALWKGIGCSFALYLLKRKLVNETTRAVIYPLFRQCRFRSSRNILCDDLVLFIINAKFQDGIPIFL